MPNSREIDHLINELMANPPADGALISSLHVFIDGTGQRFYGFHKAENCEGRGCPIHHPSEHALRDLPLCYRMLDPGPEPTIAERICEHGQGHPDPDWLDFIAERHGMEAAEVAGEHNCDGCCSRVNPAELAHAARLIETEAAHTAQMKRGK